MSIPTHRSSEFPYKYYLPKSKNLAEMVSWCETKFGPRWSPIDNRGGQWCCFWCGPRSKDEYYNHYEWLFRNETNSLEFMLRWA